MSLLQKILCGLCAALGLGLLVTLALLTDILTKHILETIDKDNKHINQ